MAHLDVIGDRQPIKNVSERIAPATMETNGYLS